MNKKGQIPVWLLVIGAVALVLYLGVFDSATIIGTVVETTGLSVTDTPSYAEFKFNWVTNQNREFPYSDGYCSLSESINAQQSDRSLPVVSDELVAIIPSTVQIESGFIRNSEIKNIKGTCSVEKVRTTDGYGTKNRVIFTACDFSGQFKCSPNLPHRDFESVLRPDGYIIVKVQKVQPSTQEEIIIPDTSMTTTSELPVTDDSSTSEVECVANADCSSICGEKSPICYAGECRCDNIPVIVDNGGSIFDWINNLFSSIFNWLGGIFK